ncbi:DHH family phosphoesterase [Paenibacillus massiliensis]|uniref:DHH family phosphoesterase n=1 Tax=Paenibacillus massiliensis TaxID=225917 RepID=UPI00046F5591|nr:bifunctional oligoribonuclease/PAP phosphatase NrnA [Paenibacillus massiliensis]
MHTYEQALQLGKEFLMEHDDYLIVSHVQPDGDAVSSTLTVGWLLSCLGKKFTMLNEGPIPQRMRFLWNADQIHDLSAQTLERKYSRVIAVDCADYRRVGLTEQYFAEDALILNIDHHPTNNGYGAVNLIKTDAAATAEILSDLLEQFDLELDVNVATAMYTGLLTDTGGFRYSNTTPKVMAIASKLLTYGVDGPGLSEMLLERLTRSQFRILTNTLQTLSMTDDGKIAWVYVTPEAMAACGAINEDLEGIVNYALNIEGVEVGILFKKVEEQSVKVSLRSAGHVDVAALAQSFGGGGHVRAAGCRIEDSLEQAINQIVMKAKEML